ncbi:MAG TPA: protein kinase [Thermoanaerobaculia bacterium]|nr:protein kinase [Thermoanaerobaculia bacterium]
MSAPFQSLGRYRLVSLLGEGGMGQVYKAYDAALGRHVAVKILPAELLTDATRVSRFIQEARAASALNHPNVIVVHDIGEERVAGRSDSIHFIAMELIDGATLREVIDGGAIEIGKALGIMLQVAEALTAAHAAGIVHRDLKPENIMVLPSGYAKVLDFGLAKLRAHPESEVSETVKTEIQDTDPGTIIGTSSYMAPEQALGKPVDHRADIFSFGSILHELVTGQRPFSGHSLIDTLHRIIYSDPEPLAAHRTGVPRDLVRIVRKALAKDPDDRYQMMKDLATDLRELLRELDAHPSAATRRVPPGPRRRWIPIAAVLVAVAIAIAFAFLRKQSAVHLPPAAPSSMHVSRITASGKVIAAAISRDGTYVAYVISDQGTQSLWVKQMESGQSRQLIAPRQVAYWGVAFGADGTIYLAEKSSANPAGAIFRISPLGGTPRPVVTDGADAPPAFSPDGRQLAFMRARWPSLTKSTLFVASTDGSNRRALATVEAPEVFVPLFFAGASWSPDGRSIAAAIRGPEKARLVSIDVATGTITTIADPGWRVVAQSAWLPDASALAAIATVEQEDRSQVWLVPYPQGEPYRLTNDLFDYRSVSITADGKRLVTVAGERMSDVWVVAEGEAPRRLTAEKTEGSHGVAALADGRIVLTSLESGNPDLWIMNGDGSGRTLLTRDGQRNRAPVVTPDERYIVYLANTGKDVELCRMNLDGSDRRVLSRHATLSVTPTVSPDSRWVVFQGIDLDSPERKGMAVLSRVPIDGGQAVPLTDFRASTPSFSPDGSEIAFHFPDADADDPAIGVIPASGGKPTRLLRAAPSATSQIAWTPDGTALVVNAMPGERANLWRLPLDGSKPTRITNFDENTILSFAPLRGRNGWVVARGEFSRDAVVITGFR